MIEITCTYHRRHDGAYHLRARKNWRLKMRKPLILSGPWVEVWEGLIGLANSSEDEQRQQIRDMGQGARTALMSTLSSLQKGGFVNLRARHADEETIRSGQSQRLSKLHLEVTHRCNFRCSACYLGGQLSCSTAHKKEATTEQWVRLAQEAGQLGCTFAVLTGGEPFLRKDLIKILEALSRNNIVSTINTNASCITSARAHALRSLSVAGVEATIYGYDRDSAGRYTGNRAGFSAALRGIRALAEENIPVRVKYFATAATCRQYERLVKELKPLGIRTALTGHGIHADIFQGKRPEASLPAQDLPQPSMVQKRSLPCFPAGTVLNIEPDGRIRACPKVTVYFGNVFQEGLGKVWQKSRKLGAFRKFWFDYCQSEGYVKGARKMSLCPAANMLGQPGGLNSFRQRWQQFRQGQGGDYVQLC